jgi:ribonuclease HI
VTRGLPLVCSLLPCTIHAPARSLTCYYHTPSTSTYIGLPIYHLPHLIASFHYVPLACLRHLDTKLFGWDAPYVDNMVKLHETASSSTVSSEDRPNKPHIRLTTHPTMKREQQTNHNTTIPPHKTDKKEARHAEQVQRINNTRDHKRNTSKYREDNTITHDPTLEKRCKGEIVHNKNNDKPRPSRSHKREAADEHRARIRQISQENGYIITYTDGSMKQKDQENWTGAGWTVYWKGIERRWGNEGMGKCAEVYNAEMLALLRGLKAAINFQQSTPETNRERPTIILFADNTSSVEAIMKANPGPSQQISQKFTETAMEFIDRNRGATIEVSWVSGHMGIEGNDRADSLAKEATDLEPITETTTIASLHRQIRNKLKTEWTSNWAGKPMTGRYAISDRIPPSLSGSHAFRTLDRKTLGIVTQARTGHGHFGEYYQIHNIQEPTNCPCGAALQTREHIVFECQEHEEHSHIIYKGAPDHQLTTLFGTKTGINALANFIRRSKAFQKTRNRETQ